MNYIVQKESLETVADSIRAKTGGSEALAFPAGFVEAVEGIKGGGSAPACAVSVKGEAAIDAFNTPLLEFGVVSVTDKEIPAYQYYRWTTTDFRRDGVTCIHANLGEMALYDFGGNNVALYDGTQEYTTSSTYASSSETRAFDGNAQTFWETDYVNKPNTTNWMQVKFPAAVQIQKIGIRQQTAFVLDDAAYSFYVSASNDGLDWTVLKEFTGVTGWTQGTEKQFSLI